MTASLASGMTGRPAGSTSPAERADYEIVRGLAADGKVGEALSLLRSNARQDPCGRFLEGVLAVETGASTAAMDLFDGLTDELPGRAEPLNNLAVLQAAAGRPLHAAQTLRRALETSDSMIARSNLADLEAAMADERVELVLIGWMSGCSVREAIEETLRAWAESWSAQDVDGYLGRYSEDFRPAGGVAHGHWQALRSQRLSEPQFVQVGLSDIVVSATSAERVQAKFSQTYSSDTFRDVVRKTLVLVLQGGQWKIVSEAAE